MGSTAKFRKIKQKVRYPKVSPEHLGGPRQAYHPGCLPERYLGRTYRRILDFSFGGRTENGHDMVL